MLSKSDAFTLRLTCRSDWKTRTKHWLLGTDTVDWLSKPSKQYCPHEPSRMWQMHMLHIVWDPCSHCPLGGLQLTSLSCWEIRCENSRSVWSNKVLIGHLVLHSFAFICCVDILLNPVREVFLVGFTSAGLPGELVFYKHLLNSCFDFDDVLYIYTVYCNSTIIIKCSIKVPANTQCNIHVRLQIFDIPIKSQLQQEKEVDSFSFLDCTWLRLGSRKFCTGCCFNWQSSNHRPPPSTITYKHHTRLLL